MMDPAVLLIVAGSVLQAIAPARRLATRLGSGRLDWFVVTRNPRLGSSIPALKLDARG
ncbi:hypothetical protein [Sphingomonas sp. 3-13AW]|uniref:hypothetical protein n=1 Tax=Sphingomonas sp. 3-13AW TaxID=3050450 RepID=UPI003BB5D276